MDPNANAVIFKAILLKKKSMICQINAKFDEKALN